MIAFISSRFDLIVILLTLSLVRLFHVELYTVVSRKGYTNYRNRCPGTIVLKNTNEKHLPVAKRALFNVTIRQKNLVYCQVVKTLAVVKEFSFILLLHQIIGVKLKYDMNWF